MIEKSSRSVPLGPLSNYLEEKRLYFTDRLGLLVLKFNSNNSQMFDLFLTCRGYINFSKSKCR